MTLCTYTSWHGSYGAMRMLRKEECTRETFWDGRATPCLNLTLVGRVTDVVQKVWRLKQMWQRRKEDSGCQNRR